MRKGGKQPADNPYGKDNVDLQLATGLCTKKYTTPIKRVNFLKTECHMC